MEILGQNLCWCKLAHLYEFKSLYHSGTVKKSPIFSSMVLSLTFLATGKLLQKKKKLL